MGSRHACHRSARRQRFFDDPPLLLHAAESPLRLSTSHLYGWLRDVHDSSWTRSSCPQKTSSVRSLTISRRYKSDAYQVTSIQPATKPHRLADASIQLADASGDSLVITDIRILQNKQGQVWAAMPSRSVSEGGRSFQFVPQIEPNRALLRKIEDAVLAAYEGWKQFQAEVR